MKNKTIRNYLKAIKEDLNKRNPQLEYTKGWTDGQLQLINMILEDLEVRK